MGLVSGNMLPSAKPSKNSSAFAGATFENK
jgi:hypothetical protein